MATKKQQESLTQGFFSFGQVLFICKIFSCAISWSLTNVDRATCHLAPGEPSIRRGQERVLPISDTQMRMGGT